MSQRLRPTLRDRSSLLGGGSSSSSPSPSGRSSPFGLGYNQPSHGHGFQPNGQRFAEDLESQNDEAIEGLSKKVKLLKDALEMKYENQQYN
ncbi:hypothetical protein CC1G_04435 [Coprinopsis cinerea okayama7|uniref:Uncharacterized protein n=1 Tax=Coprinopsis cinerea (strain Okayama-7 / 130 / ATCC MYA-4618 / FGSC 9003) TaxID=240176 RepID=A8N0L4_COPC7|nr:hypothetical protein CC1G_04435 [Coprinopsis cinerea okayama7\|eukprot:XP_001828464.1 hypothetical protein CC1G_04435 [Coprinopsis cinerea okayama7\